MDGMKDRPSLKIWLWTIGLFVVWEIFAFSFYKLKLKEEILYFFTPQIQKITNDYALYQRGPEEPLKVVVIGSSLFIHGIQDLESIAQYSRKTHGKTVQLHKIVQTGDPFKDFVTKYQLFEKLIELKPDLICIQTELAGIKLGGKKRKLKAVSKDENPLFIKVVYASNVNMNVITHFTGLFESFDSNLKELDTLNHTPSKRRVKSLEQLEYVLDSYAKLQEHSIKTVIVDIPKPKAVEDVVYTTSFRDSLAQFLEIHKERYGISHWNYNGPIMYYQHYIDYGHLNAKGRKIYTEWLVDKIIEEEQH
ncbi:hypothetical protein [Sediminitomix flava]|uniref:GDSL-like lipase/acylhydrolase family protein n=1 Tax=Sediminitomix flava TaxID=379075 RepID=A0A315YYA8_SEDFL|nr:hypothetical protein [Sediminitomix flava]PWJ35037.1 hypothetical protein BC781_11078 [Sediminitomix flava]